jgi:ABC-type Na+ transport system ATPase subunit NatA
MELGKSSQSNSHFFLRKTSIISILTGLFPPTSGSATVAGFDITKDINKVQKCLGGNHGNVLFSYS